MLEGKRESGIDDQQRAERLFPGLWILEGLAAGEPCSAATPGGTLQGVLDGFVDAEEGVRPVVPSGSGEAPQLACHAFVEPRVGHRDGDTSCDGGSEAGEHRLGCVQPASGHLVNRPNDVVRLGEVIAGCP